MSNSHILDLCASLIPLAQAPNSVGSAHLGHWQANPHRSRVTLCLDRVVIRGSRYEMLTSRFRFSTDFGCNFILLERSFKGVKLELS